MEHFADASRFLYRRSEGDDDSREIGIVYTVVAYNCSNNAVR